MKVVFGEPDKMFRLIAEAIAPSPVCTENLNPDIMVMKSAKNRA